jgi:hypothetical protein
LKGLLHEVLHNERQSEYAKITGKPRCGRASCGSFFMSGIPSFTFKRDIYVPNHDHRVRKAVPKIDNFHNM